MEETALPAYFGEWLKRRRKGLDLTQAELAQRVGCSLPALRKIHSRCTWGTECRKAAPIFSPAFRKQ
jgi:hypothetical protein